MGSIPIHISKERCKPRFLCMYCMRTCAYRLPRSLRTYSTLPVDIDVRHNAALMLSRLQLFIYEVTTYI